MEKQRQATVSFPCPVNPESLSNQTEKMWSAFCFSRFNYIHEITSSRLIIFVALFLITFANAAFFSNVLEIYPVSLKNIGFLASLVWVFAGFTVLLLSLVCYKYTIKPVLITILLTSSVASYFMDSYNTIIDDSMIRNIVNTDLAESLDLLSSKLILYFAFIGVLPSFLVWPGCKNSDI